jgi:hypothetical protein
MHADAGGAYCSGCPERTARPAKGRDMQGSTEYVVAASPGEAFESLKAVVRERQLVIVYSDERHNTLTFTPTGEEWGACLAVRCAVLDAGYGVTKLVLTGVVEGGSRSDLGAVPLDLLSDVERRVVPPSPRRSDEVIRQRA